MAVNTVVGITVSLLVYVPLALSSPCPPSGCPTHDTDDVELIQKRIDVESSLQLDQGTSAATKARRKAQLLADRSYYSSFVDMSQTRFVAGMPIYNAHDMPGGVHPTELQLATTTHILATFIDNAALTGFCSSLQASAGNDCSCIALEDAIHIAEIECSEAAYTTFLRDHEEAGGDMPTFSEPDASAFALDDGHTNYTALLEAAVNGGTNVWGIDRIDGLTGTDGKYAAYPGSKEGSETHVYVADTGLYWQHEDFEGRAQPAIEVLGGSSNPKNCSSTATDCATDGHGHGTHCAGTIGSRTYGVAKKTKIYGVKVLNPSGYMSDIIASVNWVIEHGNKPAVWSASLGGPGARPSYEAAFKGAVQAGVVISVAAGNSNADACNFSPAFAPSAITVGSTTSADQRSHFSCYGTCLDIWAPGSSIKSLGKSGSLTATMSGTSMACPHVSGVMALFLSDMENPDPQQAEILMKQVARQGEISDIKAGSPDLFLYTGGSTNPINPGATYTTTTAPTTTTTTVYCQDIVVNGSKWHDSYGPIYDCEWYASGSSYCSSYGSGWKNMGYVANEACCACGGGIKTPPTTNVTTAAPLTTTVTTAAPPTTTVTTAAPPTTTVTAAPPTTATTEEPATTTNAPSTTAPCDAEQAKLKEVEHKLKKLEANLTDVLDTIKE